jgi:hypothetical protein
VPSADREHGVAQAHGRRQGPARARGSRLCAVTEPWAVAIPRTSSGSRPPRSAGRELAGEDDARLGGPGALLAGDARDDAAPDVEDVGGALAQQRLVERAVAPATCSAASCHARSAVAPPRSRVGRARAAPRRRAARGGRRRSPPRRRRRARPRVAVARDRRRAAGERLVEALALALGRSAARSGGGPGRRGGARADRRRRPRRPRREHVARLRRRDGAPRAPRGAGAARRPRPRRDPSPKPSSASARSAASASAACGPEALDHSVSPERAPSATTLVRLVRRPARRRRLGHAHVGVVAARDLDEARARAARAGRSRCGPRGAPRRRAAPRGASRRAARRRSSAPELRRLHRQRAARLGGHLLERRAAARGDRRGHRALHQRSVAQHHASGGASSISMANSALMSALPRSMSTSTPSSDIARSIAARTPLGVGAQRPARPSRPRPPA